MQKAQSRTLRSIILALLALSSSVLSSLLLSADDDKVEEEGGKATMSACDERPMTYSLNGSPG